MESNPALRCLWRRHLERNGVVVEEAGSQQQAADRLHSDSFDAMVLNLVLQEGSAMAVADLANYRQPDCRVIFVTDTSFFSDGTIFNLFANACAFLPSATPPEDIAATAEHYAAIRRP